MANFYIDALTFDLATVVYADIALSTKAPDGYYSVNNGYRQQVGGFLLAGIITCDDPIVATNDSYSSVVTVGMNGNNILANDTVNGVPATIGNVQIAQVSSTNANVNINTSNGAVVVNTVVPVGTYTVVYRICQLSNITNCSTANITVNVTPLTITACYEYSTDCATACYPITPPTTGECKTLSVTINEADVIASDNSTVTMTYTDCTGNPLATYPFNDGGVFLVDLCVANGSSFAFSYLQGGASQNSGASGAIIQGPCPEPFVIDSERVNEGFGTLDILGGEPNERIYLDFEVTPDGTFNSLSFSSPVSVSVLDSIHTTRTGYIDLDSSGNGSSDYDFDPTTTMASCLVTITSRSSGLTTGVGDSTNII